MSKLGRLFGQYSWRFYRYLFSNILLIIMVISIIGVVTYNIFITEIQRDKEISSIESLKEASDKIDARLEDLAHLAIRIGSDAMLSPFMMMKGGVYASEAIKELNKYKANNTFIYDIALYYPIHSHDIIYSPDGTYRLDDFFERIYKYEHWSKYQFITEISNMKFPFIHPAESVKVRNSDVRHSFVTYIYPLAHGSPAGTVIFIIDARDLTNIMQSTLADYDYNGYSLIIDKEGYPIVSTASKSMRNDIDYLKDLSTKANTLSEGVNLISLEGEQYSVTKTTSRYSKWAYVTAVPIEQFMGEIIRNQNVFNYIILSLAVISIIVAFVFTLLDYKPIQKLVQTIRLGGFVSETEASDEITFIADTVNSINLQNKELASKLKTQAMLAKEQLLLAILKNKFKSQPETLHMLDVSGMKFTENGFIVLLLLVDDYDNFTRTNSKAMQDILRYSIINVAEELSTDIGHGYGVDLIDDRGVALLLNTDISPDVGDRVNELAYRIKDFFRANFNFTLTVCIGDIHENISMASESFKEANEMIGYRTVKGRDAVISYKDKAARGCKDRYWYPVESEMRLIAAIKQGEESEIDGVVNDIIADIKKYDISPKMIQCIYFGIINNVMNMLNQSSIEVYDVYGMEADEMIVPNFESIKALKNHIVEFCKKACCYIKEHKSNDEFDLINKVKAYADEHYCDYDICLDNIASRFGMSPSYITTLFKARFGYTLIKYIDSLRMDKVKRLLEDSDMSLKDILDSVGYGDETSFIKKFKRLEGLTPIQYRNKSKYGGDAVESDIKILRQTNSD